MKAESNNVFKKRFQHEEGRDHMKQRIGRVRWSIGLIMALGVLINYFDRTNISVATKPMMKEYGLTLGQMGWLLSSFGWTYAILQIPVGALLDRIGVKWLMRVGTIIWTIATAMTAVVSGMGLIVLSRVLLGAAEAPAFPGASKATGYWFPLKERGVATSLFDAAAKFSNVIGVPIVAWAVTMWGWRGGFFLTAALSLIYTIIYWAFYRDPKEHPSVTKEELAYIKEGGAQEEGTENTVGLGYLLRQRKVWGLALGFAAYGYSFYLFLTWLPGYLENQMHMSVLKSGWYTIIPWVVATITDLLIGGFLVDKLIAKGKDPSKVRKTIMVIGMIMGLFVIGAGFTNNPNVAITFITIALAGLAFSAPVAWSIPSIIAPKGAVGKVGSLMNFTNNVMGIAAPIITGYIAGGTGSFATGFILAGVIILVGIVCYVALLGRVEEIKVK